MEFDEDILRELTSSELESLMSLYKQHYTYSLISHHFILNHCKWMSSLCSPSSNEEQVYVPDRFHTIFYTHRNGNLLKNGTYIAISKDFMLNMFTLQADQTELIECLQKTNRINWALDPIQIALHNDLWSIMDSHRMQNHLEIINQEKCGYYILPKHIAVEFQYSVPNGYMLKPLTTPHADLINSVWRSKNPKSLFYIRGLIGMNGGIGLFRQDNGALVSWAIKNDFNGLGILHTLESYQRKGLASIALKALCRNIAESDNVDILVFVEDTNEISLKLISRFGFELGAWCAFIRYSSGHWKK